MVAGKHTVCLAPGAMYQTILWCTDNIGVTMSNSHFRPENRFGTVIILVYQRFCQLTLRLRPLEWVSRVNQRTPNY